MQAPRLPNSKEEGAIKSFSDRPEGASQSHSKAKAPSGMEKAVQQRQPLLAVQHLCRRAHDLEAVQGVRLDAGKPCPRRLDALRLDGQRDILAFT